MDDTWLSMLQKIAMGYQKSRLHILQAIDCNASELSYLSCHNEETKRRCDIQGHVEYSNSKLSKNQSSGIHSVAESRWTSCSERVPGLQRMLFRKNTNLQQVHYKRPSCQSSTKQIPIVSSNCQDHEDAMQRNQQLFPSCHSQSVVLDSLRILKRDHDIS